MTDFLSHLFLESPIYLGAFSFLLFAVVLLLRVRWEAPAARRYALPLTLLAIALLFVLQKLVVTQRESLIDALEALVRAVEREDLAALGGFISDGYDSEDLDREKFLEHASAGLQAHDIRDVRLSRFDATFDGPIARLTFAARATVSYRGQIGQPTLTRWRIDWVREQDAWKITAVRPIQINGMPFDSLRGLTGAR